MTTTEPNSVIVCEITFPDLRAQCTLWVDRLGRHHATSTTHLGIDRARIWGWRAPTSISDLHAWLKRSRRRVQEPDPYRGVNRAEDP